MGLIFFRNKNKKYAKKYAKFFEDKSAKRKSKWQGFFVFLIIFIPTSINLVQGISSIDTTNPYKEISEENLNLNYPCDKINSENLKTKLYDCGLENLSENFSPLNISSRSTNKPTSDLFLTFEECGYMLNTIISFTSETYYNVKIKELFWEKKENDSKANVSLTGQIQGDSQLWTIYFVQTFTIEDSAKSFVFTNFKLLNTSTDDNTDKMKNFTNDMAFLMFANASECSDDNQNQGLCYKLGYSTYTLTNQGINFLLGD